MILIMIITLKLKISYDYKYTIQDSKHPPGCFSPWH